MYVLPTPTSQIYVGVGGNVLVLPTPTSAFYRGVVNRCVCSGLCWFLPIPLPMSMVICLRYLHK